MTTRAKQQRNPCQSGAHMQRPLQANLFFPGKAVHFLSFLAGGVVALMFLLVTAGVCDTRTLAML